MRVSIEKHHRDRITQLAQQLGTQNPSVAVNYLINLWAAGEMHSVKSANSAAPVAVQSDDEFAALADWGSVAN